MSPMLKYSFGAFCLLIIFAHYHLGISKLLVSLVIEQLMIELKLSRQSRHPILHFYSYFIDLYFSYCWTLWLKLSTLWQEFFCNPKLCQTYIVSWNSIFPPSKILPSSNLFPHCEIFLPKFGGNFPGGNIPPNTRSWNWPRTESLSLSQVWPAYEG